MCNHVTIVPPLRALLESPDLRLDGFIGPGHVSTVVGARPFEFIPARVRQAGRDLRLRAARRPAVGPDDPAPARATGRCEVENQYTRVVPYEGNAARAARSWPRSSRCARTSSGAASASSPRAALRLSDAYADFDAELRFSVPGVRVADPKACQCGEVLKGVIKPWECKVFGTACTPERPIGTCMVELRGRVRRLLQLRPASRAAGALRRRCERDLGARGADPRDHRDAPARSAPKFRDERITMAHGAGGKATAALDRGPARAGVRSAMALAELADAGARSRRRPRADDRRFVVKPLRFPGGSIGELAVNGTVNDLADGRRAAARAQRSR